MAKNTPRYLLAGNLVLKRSDRRRIEDAKFTFHLFHFNNWVNNVGVVALRVAVASW